jgi:putative transcriptional regulator
MTTVSEEGSVDSLKGQLLLSGGGLYDPNFRHTVVLLADHGPWGAVGVVLNRPLDVTVDDAVPTLSELVDRDTRLFQGGPVEPDQAVLLAEVTRPDILDLPVLGSIGFLTGAVASEVRPYVKRARVYVGHSGWGPGQLETEMASNAWITEPPSAEDVFTRSPDALWRRILERKGPEFATLARMPFDPSMN